MDQRKFATDRETLERECRVDFYKATGPGGQHRNKRETAVRLVHEPSGLAVTAVERRSQAQNLEEAYRRLARRLEALNFVPKKRKPTKPTAAAKAARLQDKEQRSRRKERRRKITSTDGE